MKKIVIAMLCLAMLGGTIAGCSNSGTTGGGTTENGTGTTGSGTGTAGTGSTGGTGSSDSSKKSSRTDVTFAITSEPATLVPFEANEFTAFTLHYQLFNRLIEQKADGSFVPSLAKSWDYSSDGKQITFYLREGVKFHNGEEMTSDDVVYSVNNAIASPAASSLTSVMEKMEAVDKYTCKLYLKQAYGPIESCLVAAQLSVANKAAAEKDLEAFRRNPIGTGPYQFAKWDIGDKIVLKAFDSYWEGVPLIKDVTFKITLDTSAILVALEAGDVDFCDTIPNSQVKTVEGNPNIVTAKNGAPATWYVCMNLSKEPFNDINLRKALACAIDPEAAVIGAIGGLGTPNKSMCSDTVFGFPENWKSAYPYDVEKAKEYLKQSKYPNGLTVEFTIMDDSRFIALAEVVAEYARQIGVNLEIQKYERASWLEKVRTQHDYSAVIMSTSPGYPDADYLYTLHHSSYIPSAKNWGEINDPEIDRLLDKGRASSDKNERLEAYKGVVTRMDEMAYNIGVFQTDQYYFLRAGLEGFVPSATRRCFIYDWYWK